jgi:hypothetical protein
MKHEETKSRTRVTRTTGDRADVLTTNPASTCHPGENVEFYSLANPPVWKCAKYGGVIRVENVVNKATIFE